MTNSDAVGLGGDGSRGGENAKRSLLPDPPATDKEIIRELLEAQARVEGVDGVNGAFGRIDRCINALEERETGMELTLSEHGVENVRAVGSGVE